MSKALPASCVGGVVTVDGLPLIGAVVGGEGVGQSTGVALLDEENAFYIPDSQGDLKTTLTKLIDVLTQLNTALNKTVDAVTNAATGLTTLDAKPTGGTGSAVVPTVVSAVAAIGTASASITTAATSIAAIKAELTLLKGSLV